MNGSDCGPRNTPNTRNLRDLVYPEECDKTIGACLEVFSEKGRVIVCFVCFVGPMT